jgi:hypothetical protein
MIKTKGTARQGVSQKRRFPQPVCGIRVFFFFLSDRNVD